MSHCDDRTRLESILRRNTPVHLYELGDLDEAFFPLSRYYLSPADPEGGLALVYRGSAPPTLIALAGDARELAALEALIPTLLPSLGERVHAHISPELLPVVARVASVAAHGRHRKYALVEDAPRPALDTQVVELGPGDAAEVEGLLEREYPEHFFHPRVLETKMAFGVRETDQLVAFAGVHVFSRSMKVAAIGNVVVARSHRGRGLASVTCAALCRALRPAVNDIGLNVAADNAAAIRCYERIGFRHVGDYLEVLVSPK